MKSINVKVVNILEKIGSIISLSAATLGFSFDAVLSGAASADIAKPLGFSQQLFSYFKNHRLIATPKTS
jgi:hypothetical protein